MKYYELRIKFCGEYRKYDWEVRYDSRDYPHLNDFLKDCRDFWAINRHDHEAEIFKVKASEKKIDNWTDLEGK